MKYTAIADEVEDLVLDPDDYEECCRVETTITCEGEDDSAEEEMTLYLIKKDGKWKVLNTFWLPY